MRIIAIRCLFEKFKKLTSKQKILKYLKYSDGVILRRIGMRRDKNRCYTGIFRGNEINDRRFAKHVFICMAEILRIVKSILQIITNSFWILYAWITYNILLHRVNSFNGNVRFLPFIVNGDNIGMQLVCISLIFVWERKINEKFLRKKME